MGKNAKYRVILDTNFLVDLARFKVDLDSIEDLLPGRLELFIPEAVNKELSNMKNKYAKAALKMLNVMKVNTLGNSSGVKRADDIIVKIASNAGGKSKILVATNDSKLRKRLKKLGVKTIYLRARKHLEISS